MSSADAAEAVEAAVGGGYFVPVAVAVVVVILSRTAWLWFSLPRTGKDAPSGPSLELPADGIFTLATLNKYDGRGAPLCLCCCGKVVNVSASENIKPGEGYGKLWAGRDATYALATLSLKPEEANRMDFKLSDFDADQTKALAGWYKHFTTKYPIVGALKEYEGWDFSSVEELAKSQTPFGAAATGQGAQAKEGKESNPEAPEATDQPKAKAQMQVKKGDRVKIKACQEDPALIGAEGILTDFVAAKGRFSVDLSEGKGVHYFKPSEIEAAPSSEVEVGSVKTRSF